VTWRGATDWSLAIPLLQFVLPMLVLEAWLGLVNQEGIHRVVRAPVAIRTAAYATMFYLFAFHGASAHSFIYFQF
jgi:hypothetical protein